mmetsp:Transcript_11668/g.18961  ORF Transcript_11668/g.18961 Transcript_11668/m.18961 type:complete len:93 (+) Transcript_11668:182-460(+)
MHCTRANHKPKKHLRRENDHCCHGGYSSCSLGTPVVCHGLESAPHVDGEIGDLQLLDEKTCRYEVHFEDNDVKPCLVMHDSVRILFQLPEDQ